MYQDGVGNACCIENLSEMLTLDVTQAFLSKLGYETKKKTEKDDERFKARKDDRKSPLE